jgi:hypothetical protein
MTVMPGLIYPKIFLPVRKRFVSVNRRYGYRGKMWPRINGRREREWLFPKRLRKWSDVQMRRCPRPNWLRIEDYMRRTSRSSGDEQPQ